jgi:hypothetical protein
MSCQSGERLKLIRDVVVYFRDVRELIVALREACVYAAILVGLPRGKLTLQALYLRL